MFPVNVAGVPLAKNCFDLAQLERIDAISLKFWKQN